MATATVIERWQVASSRVPVLKAVDRRLSAPAKFIPAKDVKSALICAIVRQTTRQADGQRHGRCAAFTQAPFWEPTCSDRLWERRNGLDRARRALAQHFSPMHAGDLDRVLERVRLEHGLAEVRRTWGAGMRALQKEFSNTVMR